MNDFSRPLQVSACLDLINEILTSALPAIMVEGEIASFKVNQDKFVFFDIKDQDSSISCFMMKFALNFPIADGMKVRLLAEPKLTKWGKFSLTVRQVTPVGEGNLKKSYELLKNKLAAEGLFDDVRKRDLPVMPTRIGVVSSEQAAGYKDFIKILENRWSGLGIILVNVPVQGVDSPAQIIGAINYLNQLPEPLDVIALIRGGGSADDLSSFSSEAVVRTVASSRTPVIVGVGHETDVNLVDLVADKRAATPSNAAELLVPDKSELIARIKRYKQTMHSGANAAIRVHQEDQESVHHLIQKNLSNYFVQKNEQLLATKRLIKQLNPDNILKKGYSLLQKNNIIINNVSDVIVGDEVNIKLNNGELDAKITDVRKF